MAPSRDQFLREHEPDQERPDEKLYGALFHQPNLTSADYLAALKELPEEQRRQAWANLTPDQRIELGNAAASTPAREVSSAYWLIPIFLGVLGGFVAYIIAKDRDPKKARNMLLFGVIWGTVIGVLLAVLPFIYYYSVITPH